MQRDKLKWPNSSVGDEYEQVTLFHWFWWVGSSIADWSLRKTGSRSLFDLQGGNLLTNPQLDLIYFLLGWPTILFLQDKSGESTPPPHPPCVCMYVSLFKLKCLRLCVCEDQVVNVGLVLMGLDQPSMHWTFECNLISDVLFSNEFLMKLKSWRSN